MSVIDKLSTALFPPERTQPYACQSCGHRFALQYQVCPDCGGYAVERVDWSELLDC